MTLRSRGRPEGHILGANAWPLGATIGARYPSVVSKQGLPRQYRHGFSQPGGEASQKSDARVRDTLPGLARGVVRRGVISPRGVLRRGVLRRGVQGLAVDNPLWHVARPPGVGMRCQILARYHQLHTPRTEQCRGALGRKDQQLTKPLAAMAWIDPDIQEKGLWLTRQLPRCDAVEQIARDTAILIRHNRAASRRPERAKDLSTCQLCNDLGPGRVALVGGKLLPGGLGSGAAKARQISSGHPAQVHRRSPLVPPAYAGRTRQVPHT